MYKNMTAKQYKALKMSGVVEVVPHMKDNGNKLAPTIKLQPSDLERAGVAKHEHKGHVEYKH